MLGSRWSKQRRHDRIGPVDAALRHIENHLASAIVPEDVARVAGVSLLHLFHAFNAATGLPLMRYVRARRANAIEPLRIGENSAAIDEPRLAVSPRLLVAGLTERYDLHDGSAIAGQWRRFMPYLGRIEGQVGKAAYGTSYYTGADGNVEYLSGVEVATFSSVPRNFGLLCVPAQRCAVFFHGDHVATLRDTWTAIWNQWLPDSGYDVADAPFFERYAESFDPCTGLGGAEIWIPIRQ
jgi:AraC family transcriptional regulator